MSEMDMKQSVCPAEGKGLLNHTNHPAERWSDEQRRAAEQYGPVTDMPFPSIPPEWSREDVRTLAERNFLKILERKPAAVMVQGEFVYTFILVELLRAAGIPALAACSRRETEEWVDPETGEHRKMAVFRFVRFREY